jgi:hypothetical protein
MRKVLIAVFTAGLLAICLSAQTAYAQDVTLCAHPSDGGKCQPFGTIQEAVDAASPDSTITIPEGERTEAGITIAGVDLTIRGAGARKTIVRAASRPCAVADRVFEITLARVRIQDLTITNGCIVYSPENAEDPETLAVGGGISNGGSLTLERVIVRENTITYTGTIPITDSLAVAWRPRGAGIFSVGSLEIINSAILTNVVNSPGEAGQGGGIYNNGLSEIVNTTISGNSVEGLYGARGEYTGGGIHNAGTLNMDYTTLVHNMAETAGGGLYSTGRVALANNLIFSNVSPTGEATCSATACEPPPLIPMNLGPLRDDTSVPVFTPGLGSASINSAACSLSRVRVDLLGNPRGQGSACDLGATEAGFSFLPVIYTPQPAPDLIVRDVIVEPAGQLTAGTRAKISVVIQNIGTAASMGRFYVDLFINPSQEPPNRAGITWTQFCRSERCLRDVGIVWLAPATIKPGESFILTSEFEANPYVWRVSTQWDEYFPAGEVKMWAYVDSYETDGAMNGYVDEINEFNNRYEVKPFTVEPGRRPPLVSSAADANPDLLAPRPQP